MLIFSVTILNYAQLAYFDMQGKSPIRAYFIKDIIINHLRIKILYNMPLFLSGLYFFH